MTDCQEICTDQSVSRDANGRKFEVINPSYREIGVVLVDGCLIRDDSKRVDWMVRFPSAKKLRAGVERVKLVELKGSNVIHAFKQMEATVRHPALAAERSLIDEGFIVSKQNPLMASSFQVAAASFKEDNNFTVRIVAIAKMSAAYD